MTPQVNIRTWKSGATLVPHSPLRNVTGRYIEIEATRDKRVTSLTSSSWNMGLNRLRIRGLWVRVLLGAPEQGVVSVPVGGVACNPFFIR